jgi:hypothetical protein
MNSRTAFHIDCTAVIPECAYQCAKCIEEMESILTDVQGVRKFYTEDNGVVVEHERRDCRTTDRRIRRLALVLRG